MTYILKFTFLMVLTILFGLELRAQYLLFDAADSFYFFKEYSFHLNLKKKDTSLLYLKLDLNTTDIEKISPQPYKGSCEFAQFFIDKKKRRIRINLFDSDKQKIKTEFYSFIPKLIKTEEIYFLNLTGLKRKLSWNTIEAILIR